MRFAPLAAGLGGAVVFVGVRDNFDLEDSAFVWGLAGFCVLAAVIAAATSTALRAGARSSATYAVLAAVAVPVLFAASIAVRYSLCLVTHCDHS